MLRDQGAFEVVWNGCPGPTGHGDELTEPLPESSTARLSSLATALASPPVAVSVSVLLSELSELSVLLSLSESFVATATEASSAAVLSSPLAFAESSASINVTNSGKDRINNYGSHCRY